MKKEGVFFLLFLFLTSCSPSGPWVYREIDKTYPPGNCAILYYQPCDKFNGIELAFLKDDLCEEASVGVFCQTIPCLNNNPSYSSLWIIVDGSCHYFTLHRLEGGQRLQLSCDATSLLLSSFLEGKEVEIQMVGFKTQYPIGNFTSQYVLWSHTHSHTI